MKLKMTTTITSYVDVETFATDHQVHVDSEDIPSQQIAKAVLIGAAKSILANFGDDKGHEPSDAGNLSGFPTGSSGGNSSVFPNGSPAAGGES